MHRHRKTLTERIEALERKLEMTDEAVEALQTAVSDLTTAFNDYTTATNQTIADLIAHEQGGGTITAADLQPISDAMDTLKAAVQAATAQVQGQDPGAASSAE